MAISLNKPADGVTNWGSALTSNWNMLEGALNGSAFGPGSTAGVGGAVAFGHDNTASYTGSAFGYNNTAPFNKTSSFGCLNVCGVSGVASSAFGYANQAVASSTSAFGYKNSATPANSSAFGCSNLAAGNGGNSAFGYKNAVDSGVNSSAFGYSNTVSSDGCSSFGFKNNATSGNASAFGYANFASGSNSSAFGYKNQSNSDKSSAFGYNCRSGALAASSFGYKSSARIAKTTSICGPQIVRKDAGESAANNFESFCGTQVTLWTNEVSLKTVADQTISLPSGCHFWLDEVGIVITSLTGSLSTQAYIHAGITGSTQRYLANVQTSALVSQWSRQRYSSLLVDTGETSIVMGVATAATGPSVYTCRFYVKGHLVEDQ